VLNGEAEGRFLHFGSGMRSRIAPARSGGAARTKFRQRRLSDS
jgi:hypothetical protein